MRRASRNKRTSGARSQDRATFSLMVHGPEYGSGEEVVINPECFPHIKVLDLVEITQPEREHPRLVLQVTSLAPVRGKLQVSVLKDIAAQFGLEPFAAVAVQRVEAQDVTVDFLELTFKDQFLSRADIWRFKVAMIGRCVFVGKHVACLGVRSQVEGLLANNEELRCGVIGADTKMIVRSRSSRLFWLVQMSAEMWEFAPDGELYYEKLLDRLLRVLVAKWHASSVSHSVTLIAFSRSFYDFSQFPSGFDPRTAPFNDMTQQFVELDATDAATYASGRGGPTIQFDPTSGRLYEDFYRVLVMNYTGPDWNHLLTLLKREFASYHTTHRWRSPDETIPADYVVRPAAAAAATSLEPPVGCSNTNNNAPPPLPANNSSVYWRVLPRGVPSRAIDGNILEAINVTLNILDKHYMDRDLNRTGQSIVMFTAGCSIFHVDERLAQLTKQRMMDNGVGMDMISLTTPPTHVVPLFICQQAPASRVAAHTAAAADGSVGPPLQSTHNSTSGSPNASCEQLMADDSVRRQRHFSLSSERLDALDAIARASSSPLQGLEKELSEFERASSSCWSHDDDDNDSTVAASETQSIGHNGSSRRIDRTRQCDNGASWTPLQTRTKTYSIPHWVNITFLDFDCRCRDAASSSTVTQRSLKHHHHTTATAATTLSSATATSAPSKALSMRSSTRHNNNQSQRHNRLLSHRAQTCACQVALNQRFMPLPPYRMFDLTAPMDRVSFPVALQKLIVGYPRHVPLPRSASATATVLPHAAIEAVATDLCDSSNHLQQQRQPSLLRQCDSVESLGAAHNDAVHICRSPDFECALSPPREAPSAEATPSPFMVMRQQQLDAFQEYDDDVFRVPASLDSPDAVDGELSTAALSRFSPLRRSERDLTSVTFTGGEVALLEAAIAAAKRTQWHQPTTAATPVRGSGRWSVHSAGMTKRGRASASSASILHSLLSPRSDAVVLHQQQQQQGRSATTSDASTIKRNATSDRLANTNATAGITIPPAKTTVKAHAMRRNTVFPTPERLLVGHAGDAGDASNASSASSSPTALDTRALLLLSKSADASTARKRRHATHRHGDDARSGTAAATDPSSVQLRTDTCTNASTSPVCAAPRRLPSSSTSLGPRDSSYQHLSRSMTMGKPSPSYYNDLLLRSPPPPPAPALSIAALTAALSAAQQNDSSSTANALSSRLAANPPGAVRRNNSEVLSSAALSAAIASLTHQPLQPLERSASNVVTNPFKYSTETLALTSQRLTSDRRRWSHLFPVLSPHATRSSADVLQQQHGGSKAIHLGPNWKSLTSPAILPLTTDYYPSAKDLHTSYTESFYTLTLPSARSETVPQYNDHDELLIEMVCQRLASDFQLVSIDAGCNSNNNSSSNHMDSDATALGSTRHHHHNHTAAASAIAPHRSTCHTGLTTNPDARTTTTNAVVYYLSMGHRIHQMIYDPELQTIDVKRYFQRASQSPTHRSAHTYRYSLWVDLTASFHALQQTFHEFPQPEENWNSLDHLLCGYHDEMADATKCRRIRFALVPPIGAAATDDARRAYAAKFVKLIEYLQGRIAPADDGRVETINVRMVATPAAAHDSDASNTSRPRTNTTACGTLRYKISCKSPVIAASTATTRSRGDDARAQWVIMHLEDALDAARNYHLDVRWLACSGIVADEFVSALKRKCKQSGLELRRIPEFSRISFLQIHPLIAPIFLPLSRTSSTSVTAGALADSTWVSDAAHDRLLVATLVERLDFVLDDDRIADANGIGVGLGIEREERTSPATAAALRRCAPSSRAALVERARMRRYRQFMHRRSPVLLRLVPRGLVWIPSYDYDERNDAARVTELFHEICRVVHASAALRDLVDACCSSI